MNKEQIIGQCCVSAFFYAGGDKYMSFSDALEAFDDGEEFQDVVNDATINLKSFGIEDYEVTVADLIEALWAFDDEANEWLDNL